MSITRILKLSAFVLALGLVNMPAPVRANCRLRDYDCQAREVETDRQQQRLRELEERQARMEREQRQEQQRRQLERNQREADQLREQSESLNLGPTLCGRANRGMGNNCR